MGLMKPQIQGPDDWWEVETTQGNYFVLCMYAGYRDNVTAVKLLDYLPDTTDTSQILCWEFKSGYGARLSAPGYLDCTDWCVLDTEREAREYLAEAYDLCPICLGDEWVSGEEGGGCPTCISKLTSEEFQDAMDGVVGGMTSHEIVEMPGVHEIVSEELNNDIVQAAYDKKVTDYETS